MPTAEDKAARTSTYSVRIKRSAEKEFWAIVQPHHNRITKRLEPLASNPRPLGSKKLLGNYRILYLIDDSQRSVEVTAVGHRRDVYR